MTTYYEMTPDEIEKNIQEVIDYSERNCLADIDGMGIEIKYTKYDQTKTVTFWAINKDYKRQATREFYTPDDIIQWIWAGNGPMMIVEQQGAEHEKAI